MDHGFLYNALVFLVSAVVMVPISKRLGMGSVLGYLLAGVVVGPWGLKLITNVQDIVHFSEFGVVLLLFLIGLELEPKKLWNLRVPIFGLGGLQVLLNSLLFFILGILFGMPWKGALVAGMGISLSSTAIALQIFKEKNFLNTSAGSSGFSILLFQDIAVILMIAVLPLLSEQTAHAGSAGGWVSFFRTIAIFALVIGGGRFLLRPLLRWIASIQLREIFTAFALLLVIAFAALMQSLELSMGLGAFIAGVLLADSEYRHALETDIEPFKGLLLGLFFISVGMSINFESVSQNPGQVLAWLSVIIVGKISVHWLLGKMFHLPTSQIPFFSGVLSQVGEFAFVLFGAAVALKVLPEETAAILSAAVALSMLTTSVFVLLYDKFLLQFFTATKDETPQDTIENEFNPVIIAGFGRFGQIIGRLLYANHITATVLDFEPDQIELLRKFGFKVYYGDAPRMDLLQSAGAAQAKILVVAIDDVEDSLRLIDLAKEHFPNLQIFARARNVQHVYKLMDRQVQVIERETFESSLKMGTEVLKSLGWGAFQAMQAGHRFRMHNNKMLVDLHPSNGDQATLVAKAKQAREDLEKMFNQEKELLRQGDQGWE